MSGSRGWKQKWRGPQPFSPIRRGGVLGRSVPVRSSNTNWCTALEPTGSAMVQEKAQRLVRSVSRMCAPTPVSSRQSGGPAATPSPPIACTATAPSA